MRVRANTPSMPLLERAARLAFRQLTVPLMHRAIVEWGVPYTGRRPSLEREVAELLVGWVLPGLSAEERESILQARKMRRKSVFTTVVTTENVDMLGKTGELGEGFEDERAALETEAKAVKEAGAISFPKVQKARPQKGEVPAAVSASTASSSSSSVAPAGRPAQRLEIPDKALTVTEAREMIPQVKGCILAINKEVSWEIKYPRRRSPKSHSSAFDPTDDASQRAALLRCLRWAWRVHKEEHPDIECPYALGEAV